MSATHNTETAHDGATDELQLLGILAAMAKYLLEQQAAALAGSRDDSGRDVPHGQPRGRQSKSTGKARG